MKRLAHLIFGQVLVGTLLAQAQTCPTPVAPDTARGGFTINLGERFCVGNTVSLTNSANVQAAQYWYEYAGSAVPTTGGTTARTFQFTRPGKFTIIQKGTLNGRNTYACRVVEVLAQPSPVFTLFSCAPGLVTLTLPEGASNPYEEYVVRWGLTGSAPQTVTRDQTPVTFTYPSASTLYNVRVDGRYAPGGCGGAALQQTLANGVPPNAQKADLTRLELTGGSTATLAMTSFRGGTVEVFQRLPNGAFATTGEKLTTSTGSNAVSLKNLNNQTQTCFKAVFTDVCQRRQDSDELCSLPLRVTAQSQQNQVDWTAYPALPTGLTFGGYTLRRNGAVLPPVVTAIGTTRRTDAPVKCGEAYAYQLTARIGGMESVSETKTVTGVSTLTPPAVTAFNATVANGLVGLSWTAPPAGTPPNDGLRKYTLTRSDDGGAAFAPLRDSLAPASTAFLDQTAQPSTRSYCYVLRYADACGNQSLPSAPACPVLLRQDKSELDWTAYRGGFSGTYTVEEVDAADQPLGSQPVGAALRFEPDPNRLSGQQVRFRVKATGLLPTEISYSNVIAYSLALSVQVPQVFTPNGDGINDAFEVKGLFIQAFNLKIYNRWGEPVFATDDRQEGWNGLANGTPAPAGEYAYQLDVVDFRGNAFRKRGSVLLTR